MKLEFSVLSTERMTSHTLLHYCVKIGLEELVKAHAADVACFRKQVSHRLKSYNSGPNFVARKVILNK